MPSLASLSVAFAVGVAVAAHISSPICLTTGSSVVSRPLLTLLLWLAATVAFIAHYGARGRALLVVVALLGGLRVTVADIQQRSTVLPDGVRADDRTIDRLIGVVDGPIVRIPGDTGPRVRILLDLERPARARVEVKTDAVSDIRPGDRLLVTGRLFRPRGYRVPGAVDRRRAARARGIDFTMSARALAIVDRNARWTPWRAAAHAHDRVVATVAERGGDPIGNALVRALTAGDQSGLDRAAKERYRDAGVAHILAVSGLHLAVIAVFVFAAVRWLWATVPALALRVRPALVGALCAAPLACAYTFITGGRVSTLRALLVVTVVLCGSALARRARVLDALGLAALALLVHRPYCLFDLGFQLSFAATATLILVAGRYMTRTDGRSDDLRLAQRLGRSLLTALRASLSTSLWATLATAPIIAAAFGHLALGGFVGNAFAVPMTELCILPLGLAGAVLYQISPALGGVLLDMAIAVAGLLDRALGLLARALPPVSIFPPNGWELCGFVLTVGAVVWCVRAGGLRQRRVGRLVVAVGLVATLAAHFVTTYAIPGWRSSVIVTFLDVGQGDAAVVELPGGAVWMIDGGGLPFVFQRSGALDERDRRRRAATPGRQSVARFLAERRIRHIDRLVISHPHPDHYEGLFAILDQISVAEVWVAAAPRQPPDSYRALLAALRASGASITHPRLEHPYVHGPVTATALAPRYHDPVATEDPVSSANDNSLTIRLTAYGRTILFPGDLEEEGEELLLSRALDLRADMIKVAHHGSRTSSTAPFVRAVRPGWAVVSCGLANRFRFPAPEVVARWRSVGARVVRTDLAGAVTATISPDGALRVSTFD